MRPLLRFFLFLAIASMLSLPTPGARQTATTDAQRGMELFTHGRYKEAITYLKRAAKETPQDFTVWHALGLAYFNTNDRKNAQSAFERAAKINPASAPVHTNLAYIYLLRDKLDSAQKEATTATTLDATDGTSHYVLAAVALRQDHPELALQEAAEALRLKPGMGPALLVRSEASLDLYYGGLETNADRKQLIYHLDNALAALDQFVRENQPAGGTGSWPDQLLGLRYERERFGGSGVVGLEKIYSPQKVEVKARVSYKPSAEYPEEERQNGQTGVVRLRAILTANGRVAGIVLMRSPGPGFSRAAIEAVKQVKFTPATIAGKPVSQYQVFEYYFSSY